MVPRCPLSIVFANDTEDTIVVIQTSVHAIIIFLPYTPHLTLSSILYGIK